MSSDAAPTAPPPAPDAARVGTRRSAAVEAAMTSAYRVLSSGTIFTGLVLAYAAGPLVIGLAGAIPFLARSGQLVAPPLVRRVGASRVMRLAGWLERLCYVAPALVGLARPPHAIA